MRIKTKLAKLEASIGGNSASPEAISLLISCVGKVDALFWPQRSEGSHGAELKRLRQEYRLGLHGVNASGFGADAWKDQHYIRRELEAKELIETVRGAKEVTGVTVTLMGYRLAMVLLELDLMLSELLLRFLEIKQKTPCRKGGWVSESVLFNRECVGDPDDWQSMTAAMLPCLVSGQAESTCDTKGRVYFRCTQDTDQHPVTVNLGLGAVSTDDAWALYLKAFNAEFSNLSTVQSADNGLSIPLPATR